MTEYHEHLDREWDILGWPKDGDDPQAWIYQHLCELLHAFAGKGHSGTSAPYTLDLFQKAAHFKPLSPLTGAPEEWVEVGSGVFQNRRCSHVFKEDGRAYDSEGRVFRAPDGECYTSFESRVPIEFPYTPERTYVDVDADDGGSQGAVAGTEGADGERATAIEGDQT